jgi:hypothetical protein
MSETRWVEVEAAKALIEKMIDCVAETQGRFSADLMIELEAQLDSLAELDALSQISSKNYGADDIGLTHEEVDSFLSVEREPVECKMECDIREICKHAKPHEKGADCRGFSCGAKYTTGCRPVEREPETDAITEAQAWKWFSTVHDHTSWMEFLHDGKEIGCIKH